MAIVVGHVPKSKRKQKTYHPCSLPLVHLNMQLFPMHRKNMIVNIYFLALSLLKFFNLRNTPTDLHDAKENPKWGSGGHYCQNIEYPHRY